ncbi:hypothetical protein HYP99_gp095 [Sinorhizobium phage ort11]|uniref:Uncharacterized protein n=1 Tax=Sinorhizobium phage ort11 TaxID=2599764 RepID=A0A5C2H1F9_9CAUD|nr:hypothetical protein HYP99_gp095 [Sinorhizobium phage ort11]QEP29898.1 hypothetical protein Smphiort11_0100 [Sinorhizobium phage ort11]
MNLHWYCFTYAYYDGFGNGHCCTYEGFPIQGQFGLNCIEEAKAKANPECPPNRMVLLNIIYLGHMTKEQFTYIPEEIGTNETPASSSSS